MANRATRLKGVTVEEIAKTSLAEAGIHTVNLPNGTRVVAIANTLWPMHDRNMHVEIMKFLADYQPDLVVLLGHMVNNEAFQALFESEKNYLHRPEHPPEVKAALAAGSFDDQVQYLRREASKYIGSFAVGKAKVVYIPAILTEHKLVKRVSQEKERRDNYVDNHPEAADQPSDPLRKLPIDFRNFLYLNKNPRVRVLPYNSALLANNHTLFMIGDFKRRNEGDAALVEWQQRHYPAIIRSLDGKLASGWFTTTEHTQPTLTVMQHQVHEIGFLWDEVQNGQLRDYDRRAQGFFAGIYVDGELFGSTIDILRGDDDRRSFYAPDGTLYTEDTPGNMPHGTTLSLDDEPVTDDDDWVLRDDDGEDDDEGEEVKPAAEKKSTRKPAAKKKKPAASKRKRS
ncbi:MAG: hypothetical protein LCH63_21370 [Candidatus Melainabacteria bacterium]|nr:hypothetical protein [Candidatus Melainabacteria bacterium]